METIIVGRGENVAENTGMQSLQIMKLRIDVYWFSEFARNNTQLGRASRRPIDRAFYTEPIG